MTLNGKFEGIDEDKVNIEVNNFINGVGDLMDIKLPSDEEVYTFNEVTGYVTVHWLGAGHAIVDPYLIPGKGKQAPNEEEFFKYITREMKEFPKIARFAGSCFKKIPSLEIIEDTEISVPENFYSIPGHESSRLDVEAFETHIAKSKDHLNVLNGLHFGDQTPKVKEAYTKMCRSILNLLIEIQLPFSDLAKKKAAEGDLQGYRPHITRLMKLPEFPKGFGEKTETMKEYLSEGHIFNR